MPPESTSTSSLFDQRIFASRNPRCRSYLVRFFHDSTELHDLAKARQGELRVAQHTRESLSREYTTEVAQQKFENGKEIDRWVRLILTSYPPCLKPLTALDKASPLMILIPFMLLKDLRIHTHHQGRALVVRVFGEPVYLNNVVSLVNVVEDEARDVEKVQLFFSSTLPLEVMLAKGTMIAVKEPYYELCDGSSYLRVDHPSNVKILHQGDPWCLEVFKTSSEPILTATACWKEYGNHALSLKKYTDAIHCYTSGLDTFGRTEAYKRDLFRNRAAVDLLAAEAAKVDAFESLTGHNDDESRKLDTKALYRAGRSSYHLRDFLAAEELYQRLLAISRLDEDGLRELSKTQTRLITQLRLTRACLVGDLDKTEECAIALANDLGYQISIKGTNVHLDRTNGYSDMIMVDVLANFTEVAVRRGHLELALEFQSLAKEMYIITNGVISGMYKKYGKFE
ncbi:hypothetical protein D6D01_03653 [Aureobasidium pullulans]|uniref:TPR-like protein n=1 Tax=Aureobasidium pullulans TaxID=5580 RepID=A0A4S9LII1_AURPU|nr:hypothetical protein D6D01_03653 [Aureobasidium pullulans]